jgi:hypothetical protein
MMTMFVNLPEGRQRCLSYDAIACLHARAIFRTSALRTANVRMVQISDRITVGIWSCRCTNNRHTTLSISHSFPQYLILQPTVRPGAIYMQVFTIARTQSVRWIGVIVCIETRRPLRPQTICRDCIHVHCTPTFR